VKPFGGRFGAPFIAICTAWWDGRGGAHGPSYVLIDIHVTIKEHRTSMRQRLDIDICAFLTFVSHLIVHFMDRWWFIFCCLCEVRIKVIISPLLSLT
jgi:hypothetical protein